MTQESTSYTRYATGKTTASSKRLRTAAPPAINQNLTSRWSFYDSLCQWNANERQKQRKNTSFEMLICLELQKVMLTHDNIFIYTAYHQSFYLIWIQIQTHTSLSYLFLSLCFHVCRFCFRQLWKRRLERKMVLELSQQKCTVSLANAD